MYTEKGTFIMSTRFQGLMDGWHGDEHLVECANDCANFCQCEIFEDGYYDEYDCDFLDEEE